MLQLWDIEIIVWLQNIGGWMTPIMEFFTNMGTFPAYLALVTFVYWCLDSQLGLRMAIFLSLTATLNSILKQFFHAPRPYWVEPQIKAIHAASSFGMPSGHAQTATIWLFMATYLKKVWFWGVAIFFTCMIGISRVYLGVHFPSQIVVGWMFGGALIFMFVYLEPHIIAWMRAKPLLQQLGYAFGCSMLLVLLGGISVWVLRDWSVPAAWITNAAWSMGEDASLNPVGLTSVVRNAGGFLGSAWGVILIRHVGGYDAGGTNGQRGLRYLVGSICVTAVFAVFGLLSPDKTHVMLYNLWQYLGYTLVCCVALFLMPLLFQRLKLAEIPGKMSAVKNDKD